MSTSTYKAFPYAFVCPLQPRPIAVKGRTQRLDGYNFWLILHEQASSFSNTPGALQQNAQKNSMSLFTGGELFEQVHDDDS